MKKNVAKLNKIETKKYNRKFHETKHYTAVFPPFLLYDYEREYNRTTQLIFLNYFLIEKDAKQWLN